MEYSEIIHNHRFISTERALTLILYIFLFAVPLAYSPKGSEFNGIFDDFYYEPKLKIGLILLFLSALVFLLNIVSARKSIKFSSSHIFMLLFLAGMSIAFLFSSNYEKAFWGRRFRSEGLLAYLMYLAAFFLFSWSIDTEVKARKFIHVIIFSSLVASLYGLFQFAGYEILPRDHIRENWWRAFATSGNPDFLSAFLLMVLPFPVLFFFETTKNQGKYIKALWLSAVVIIYSCILATYHRGAWVGILMACLVFGLILWKKPRFRELFKSKSVFLLIAVLVLCTLGINFLSVMRGNPSLVRRVSSGVNVNSVNESTINVRTYIWQATGHLIMKRPVWGWGPDTMHDNFQKHAPKPSELGYQGSMRSKPDKPENLLLQIAYEGGMVSLVPFAITIGLVLIGLWRLIDNPDRCGIICLGIFLGLIAYLTQQQFSFSSLSSTPIFWSILGIGLGFSYRCIDINIAKVTT